MPTQTFTSPLPAAQAEARGGLPWSRLVRRRWTIAWLGAPVLAILNGGIREAAYKERLGEWAANQLSVAGLIGLLAVYIWVLQRRWPLPTRRDALAVGAAWTVLAVAFEFGFGHYVEGDSLRDLLGNYDVLEGNLWVLVLLWTAAGPVVVRELVRARRR